MSQQKSKRPSSAKTANKPAKKNAGTITSRRKRFGDTILDEIILIIVIAFSIVVIISLLSGKMGIVGRLISSFLKGIFGIGAILVPMLAIAYSLWLLVSEEKKGSLLRLLSAIVFLLCISISAGVLFPVYFDDTIGALARTSYYYDNGSFLNGGVIGGFAGGGLLAAFDKLGSLFLLLVAMLICVILGTGKSFFNGISNVLEFQKARKKVRREKIKYQAERIREEEQWEEERFARREEKKKPKGQFNYVLEQQEEEAPFVEETVFSKARRLFTVKDKKPVFDYEAEQLLEEDVLEHSFEEDDEEHLSENTALQRLSDVEKEEIVNEHSRPPLILSSQGFLEDEEAVEYSKDISFSGHEKARVSDEEPGDEEFAVSEASLDEKEGEEKPFSLSIANKEDADAKPQGGVHTLIGKEPEAPYVFPPMDLLGKDNSVQNKGSKVEMLQNAQKLEETLRSFGVEATVMQINKGPTVTRYELSPSKGVKVSKIVNLSDDIALNLAASGIRMEAPIPGKAAVGIEVPNKETQSVFLRSVMDSEAFSKFPSKLAFALGQDIAGNPVIADIAKMPHLLIAGATGSGKSVCINTLITSILYKADPKEVKLLLVDPKVVELSVYNGIPHLLIPVVTDPKKAAAALNWAVREMLARYNDFAACNVRDISGFNAMKRENGEAEGLMPQIVIVIDELADLMMAAPGEVEDAICRLAQMARAAGMHLIIATQRPSVDVITGVIKANIPSRLAFAVSSGIDSRTILDMVGAEKLLGKGDMLFYPAGMSKPQRIQGAFVTDKEVESIVQFVKRDGHVHHDEEMIEKITSGAKADGPGGEVDELFDQAVDLVVEKEKASASMLQRQFRIGYNRASRLIEELESHGIVGPEDGSKPRKVLLSKMALEDMRNPANKQD